MKLVDTIRRILDGREQSEVESYLMGTGAAKLDEETAETVESILNDERNQSFEYYERQYQVSVQEMTARQEELVRHGTELATRYLPLVLGSAGADYMMPTEVPYATTITGAVAGVGLLMLLHKYSRFKGAKKRAIRCADELKDYIDEHRDELLGTEDVGVQTIVDEVDQLVVAGTNAEQYHQLQHLDSVIKTTKRNKAMIKSNTDKIGELEVQVMKNRLANMEQDGRIDKVEKYTYCSDYPAQRYKTEFGDYQKPIMTW